MSSLLLLSSLHLPGEDTLPALRVKAVGSQGPGGHKGCPAMGLKGQISVLSVMPCSVPIAVTANESRQDSLSVPSGQWHMAQLAMRSFWGTDGCLIEPS